MTFEEIVEELPKVAADEKERLRQLLDSDSGDAARATSWRYHRSKRGYGTRRFH
jgi:hypothetical protein